MLYYWIDRKNKVSGIWGTQTLPFADGASNISGYSIKANVYVRAVGFFAVIS
jgi:hypothetical protein